MASLLTLLSDARFQQYVVAKVAKTIHDLRYKVVVHWDDDLKLSSLFRVAHESCSTSFIPAT